MLCIYPIDYHDDLESFACDHQNEDDHPGCCAYHHHHHHSCLAQSTDGQCSWSICCTSLDPGHTIPYNTMKYQETPNLLHYITLEIWNPSKSERDYTVGRLTIQYHIQYLSVGDQLTQLIVLRSCDPGSFPFNRRTNGRPVTMWSEEKPTVIGLTRSKAVHAITITGRL